MPVIHMEPPVGGLNARDSLDGLAPNEAITLVNWVPDVGYMRSRNGHIPYADLETGTPVETLIPLRLTSGSQLLAVSNLQIFDITDPINIDPLTIETTVGVQALPEVMVSNRVTHAQFKSRAIITQEGNTPFIYQPVDPDEQNPVDYEMVLGVYTEYIDPELYPGYPGDPEDRPKPIMDVTNLIKPLVYKGRVIYLDANRKSMWYCGAGAYQGEITEFPLDGILQRGGALKLLFTWSKDTGDGMDDMLVIMSTTGETLIYQGDDPGDVLGWELIQRYQLPEPIADLGVDRIGAETLIITDDGYINLSEALSQGSVSDYATFSGKISRIVKRDLDNYQHNYGWAAVFYPHGNMMLFNVPVQENKQQYQHVFNTRNGAWTTFHGWNACSIVSFENALMFGTSDGKVNVADRGTSDLGEFIVCDCTTAYHQLGNPAETKHMTAMTIIQNHAFPTSFSLNALADFRRPNLPPLVKPQERQVGTWAATIDDPAGSDWNEDYWGVGDGIVSGKKHRRPINATGHSIALSVRQQSSAQNVFWFSHTIEWTTGGRK
jgi:hypothetical protein